MSSYCALLVGVSLVIGQAPVNEDLRVLEPLIGEWEGQVELVEDLEGLGKKGDKIPVVLKYAWGGNGQSMTSLVSVLMNGQAVPFTVGLSAWCPVEKKITAINTHAPGGSAKLVARRDGDKLIFDSEGIDEDGEKTTGTFTYAFKSKDEFVVHFREGTKGGEETPDWDATFTRIDMTSTREEFEEFCELMKGRWVGEVKWVADWPGLGKKGDMATCYLDIAQVEDGNAMNGKFCGGAGSGTVLWVYDAGSKTIRGLVVYSGGMVSQLKYFKDGDQWIETGSGTLPDGRKTQGRSTMTWDGKKLRLQGQGTIDGKPNDPRDDKWQRLYPS